VARLEQQRHHVVALGDRGVGAAGADLVVDEPVDRAQPASRDDARYGVLGAEGEQAERRQRVGAPVERGTQRPSEPGDVAHALHAEDRAHDHLERDRLHPRP
jgi:hypothetical protein